jgi:hypothetical protein
MSLSCRYSTPGSDRRDASSLAKLLYRRFNDRASCPARQNPKQALARKPRIHSPASGKGGHESGTLRRSCGTALCSRKLSPRSCKGWAFVNDPDEDCLGEGLFAHQTYQRSTGISLVTLSESSPADGSGRAVRTPKNRVFVSWGDPQRD